MFNVYPSLILALAVTAAFSAPVEADVMPVGDRQAALAARAPARAELVLKLRDGADCEARAGRLVCGVGEPDGQHVSDMLESISDVVIESALPGMSSAYLDLLRREGERRSGHALADLRQYYRVRLPARAVAIPSWLGDVEASAMVSGFYPTGPWSAPSSCPPSSGCAVITCPPSGCGPGDCPAGCPTPDFSGHEGQAWRGPAPLGIDADYANFPPSPREPNLCQDVTLAIVEDAWYTCHEDLIDASFTRVFGRTYELTPTDFIHPTAVMGLLLATANGFGVTGVCPSDPAVAHRSQVVLASEGNAWGVPSSCVPCAILAAAQATRPGDVILIERVSGLLGTSDRGPASIDPLTLDVIKTITSLGYHVIEPASNENVDLDCGYTCPAGCSDPSCCSCDPECGGTCYVALSDYGYGFGRRDSGGIVVGGSYADVPHQRAGSSHGERVDAYAWAAQLTTTSWWGGECSPASCSPDPAGFWGDPCDPLGHERGYLANVGGTSGASPIVAGAVAVLEHEHERAHGMNYLPAAVRLLLRTSGTPSADPECDRIGNMPDLRDQLAIVAMGPDPAHVITAPSAGPALLGAAVGGGGDVDGDGAPDLVVGAPGSPVERGTVEIYSGTTGNLLLKLTAPDIGGGFGTAVSIISDVNDDGLADIAVGTPRAGVSGEGSVSVFAGGGTELLLYTIFGRDSKDQLGAAIASVADLDGDLVPDILIGAPDAGAAGIGPGRAYVYSASLLASRVAPLLTLGPPGLARDFGASVAFGKNAGVPTYVVGDPTAARAHIMTTDAPTITRSGPMGSSFGASVAFLPSPPTALVGAPDDTSAAGPAAGRVYVYTAAGAAVAAISGLETGARFGASVSAVDDVNSDLDTDAVVGAPGGTLASTGAGAAYLFDMRARVVLATYRGQSTADGFGSAVAGIGDVNLDGNGDILVGSPKSHAGRSPRGRAYGFLAPGWGQPFTVGACCHDGLGCVDGVVGSTCLESHTRPGETVSFHEGQSCDSQPCPSYGACCSAMGCEDSLPAAVCLDRGSTLQPATFAGAGTACGDTPPPCTRTLGACCYCPGQCHDGVSHDACIAGLGEWHPRTSCAEVPAPCE